MGKKPVLSPRKPPTPEEMARRARFVASGSAEESARPDTDASNATAMGVQSKVGSDSMASRRSSVKTSGRSKSVQLRADGREVRRHTIYLSVPLAKALAHYCVEHDTEMSAVVAEAVSRLIEKNRS